MPDAERAERLRIERERAANRAAELAADLASVVAASEAANLDDEHDPEGATVGFERAQLSALLERARARLAEVDAARERLRLGRYGVCERCGREIPEPRLVAEPVARTCVTCAGPAGRRPRRRNDPGTT